MTLGKPNRGQPGKTDIPEVLAPDPDRITLWEELIR
jgi:hypothetical protein